MAADVQVNGTGCMQSALLLLMYIAIEPSGGNGGGGGETGTEKRLEHGDARPYRAGENTGMSLPSSYTGVLSHITF